MSIDMKIYPSQWSKKDRKWSKNHARLETSKFSQIIKIHNFFRDRPVYEYEPEYESEEIESFQMEEASYDCRDHIAW